MSHQAFEAFKAKLLEDSTLREDLERALGERGASTAASIDEVVAFAKARGYDFDRAHVPHGVELLDEQLDEVVGGADKYGRVKVVFPWLAGSD